MLAVMGEAIIAIGGILDPFGTGDLFVVYALLQALILLLLIRALDFYEREPFALVFVMFFWGAIGAAVIASVGNEVVFALMPERFSVVFGPTISAPVVEELAKGAALAVALFLSQLAGRRFGLFEFDGVTDGIVYGAAVGIGFAFSEDLFYLFSEVQESGNLEAGIGVFLERRDFVGPMMLRHAIWTATLGAGIGLAIWAKGPLLKSAVVLGSLLLAMLMHAVNNGLIPVILAIRYGYETTWEYLAVGVPLDLAERMDATSAGAVSALVALTWLYVAGFLIATFWFLRRQREMIGRQLGREVEVGSVTEAEAETVLGFHARTRQYLGMLRDRRVDEIEVTGRIDRGLVDLAFARQRQERDGESDQGELDRLRFRIAMAREELDAVRVLTGGAGAVGGEKNGAGSEKDDAG
jgi:protease PrsW